MAINRGHKSAHSKEYNILQREAFIEIVRYSVFWLLDLHTD